MNIEINPETERVVREELRQGHFQSVDDLILSGVQAWREHNLPARDERIEALRAAIDEGDASGLAEGDVFAQVRQKLGLNASR